MSFQYALIGAFMVVVPFMIEDPDFLCQQSDGTWESCEDIKTACDWKNPIKVDESNSA